MASEHEFYHVSEIKGEVCLMVKIESVPVPDCQGVDGQTYNAVAAWRIHSKHPDVDTAERVKASLLYDMNNPS